MLWLLLTGFTAPEQAYDSGEPLDRVKKTITCITARSTGVSLSSPAQWRWVLVEPQTVVLSALPVAQIRVSPTRRTPGCSVRWRSPPSIAYKWIALISLASPCWRALPPPSTHSVLCDCHYCSARIPTCYSSVSVHSSQWTLSRKCFPALAEWSACRRWCGFPTRRREPRSTHFETITALATDSSSRRPLITEYGGYLASLGTWGVYSVS